MHGQESPLMSKKGLKSPFLRYLMSVCAQALSLGDDWSIHHKRGKVGDIPALVMEVTQQHLYKEFCKCANALGGNERGFLTLLTPFHACV